MYPSFMIICNTEGKLAFYKNYKKISHTIIEECSSYIPHISKNQTQHNFCDYLGYRLLYLPLADYWLIMGTSLDSNVIQDNEIIKKMYEIIMHILEREITLENICEHLEDILIALDELISLSGLEDLSILNLETFLEMESYNEKQLTSLISIQEKELKKKRELDELEKKKLLKNSNQKIETPIIPENIDYNQYEEPETIIEENKKNILNLNKQKKQVVKKKLIEKKEIVEEKFNPLSDSLNIYSIDNLTGKIKIDGSIENFEVKGGLYVNIINPILTKPIINIKSIKDKNFNIKLPPFLDKNSWKNKKIKLKSATQNLQIRQELNLLRYTMNKNTSNCPFMTNLWIQGNEISGEIEFNKVQTLFNSLKNIKIIFNNANNFEIENIETEECEIISENDKIICIINELNNETDNVSFTINFDNQVTENYLLPAIIDIKDENSLIGITIDSIENDNNIEGDLLYNFKGLIETSNFIIE